MTSSDIKKLTITEPFLAMDFKLGEAPYWHAPTNTLRFVDIVRKRVYQYPLSHTPSSPTDVSALRTFNLTDSVGTTAEIAGEDGKRFIFGGKAGVGVMDRETGEWEYVKRWWGDDVDSAEIKEKTRLFRGNDGAVDAKGRYFLGVMNDPMEGEIKDEGVLFRLDPDLSLHKVLEPVAIPNGISWSLDNKHVYFTSSTDNKITKYPYNLDTGDIDLNSGETFFQAPYEGGVPDGHARDAEGCFWIACYGTSKVVRVNEQGKVLVEISLPTRCITCPAIAGDDLFITCAEEEEPDKHPESVKHQGGLFKINIGVKGAPLNEFRPAKKLA
ncbi:SMP-30/Gluconolactonase/LRE-like region-containing protein [Elsinoe fawcettii]|nr:SMP-30/Gluconolactonase/LRE-like region-containing protein [Elsinoe fawcettii]